jgi:hypothetical protein
LTSTSTNAQSAAANEPLPVAVVPHAPEPAHGFGSPLCQEAVCDRACAVFRGLHREGVKVFARPRGSHRGRQADRGCGVRRHRCDRTRQGPRGGGGGSRSRRTPEHGRQLRRHLAVRPHPCKQGVHDLALYAKIVQVNLIELQVLDPGCAEQIAKTDIRPRRRRSLGRRRSPRWRLTRPCF